VTEALKAEEITDFMITTLRPYSSFQRSRMGQKRLISFFQTAPKKSKSTEASKGDAADTGEPTAHRSAEKHDATDPAVPSNAAPPPPPPQQQPTEEQTHAMQLTQLQTMRARANKNHALCKQVVNKAEANGTQPLLADLLNEPAWHALLSKELNAPYFSKGLQDFLAKEWSGTKPIFPPKHSVFRALNACPPGQVKVVILGQDPYHNYNQAMGLSFSVPQGLQLPSSLRNIYKELKTDINCPIASHGNLEKWTHQGVLLLNACLTVRAHEAASHSKKGWEKFTDEVVRQLSRERTGLVFLLWGKFAQERGKAIENRSQQFILNSAHPSGLSASRGFFGCKHFSQVNEILVKQGKLPIDWCID
jgi:uracil-DNA glycosylase